MRPIDADAVCKRCRKSGAICTGSDCEIPKMPTLTPPNEWVSVEERLPPPKQNVLAYSLSGGVAEADYADGVWMQYRWSAVMDDVTHWRPLPAPPERQEDADA